jgi:transcription initiation factor TFIIIB Brf1 subunit/transcription initiation factor TFIIB
MSTSSNEESAQKDRVILQANRILRKLDCGQHVRDEVISLIERADKKGILKSGTPRGLAAGAVYIACILQEDRMSLDTIGRALSLSGSTVSKNYIAIARGLGFQER